MCTVDVGIKVKEHAFEGEQLYIITSASADSPLLKFTGLLGCLLKYVCLTVSLIYPVVLQLEELSSDKHYDSRSLMPVRSPRESADGR